LSHTNDCLSNLFVTLTSDRSSSLLTPPPPTIPVALTFVHLSPSNCSISSFMASYILVSSKLVNLPTLAMSTLSLDTVLDMSVIVAS
jgi:hypothetical protein